MVSFLIQLKIKLKRRQAQQIEGPLQDQWWG